MGGDGLSDLQAARLVCKRGRTVPAGRRQRGPSCLLLRAGGCCPEPAASVWQLRGHGAAFCSVSGLHSVLALSRTLVTLHWGPHPHPVGPCPLTASGTAPLPEKEGTVWGPGHWASACLGGSTLPARGRPQITDSGRGSQACPIRQLPPALAQPRGERLPAPPTITLTPRPNPDPLPQHLHKARNACILKNSPGFRTS